jgi:hypothetical protein
MPGCGVFPRVDSGSRWHTQESLIQGLDPIMTLCCNSVNQLMIGSTITGFTETCQRWADVKSISVVVTKKELWCWFVSPCNTNCE